MVDLFHEFLLDRGLISSQLEDISDRLEGDPEFGGILQREFDKFYEANPEGFKEALLEARDYMGTYVADAISEFSRRKVGYAAFGAALEEIDTQISGGRFRGIIAKNFATREIGKYSPGPRLKKPDEHSHSLTDRTLTPRHFRK